MSNFLMGYKFLSLFNIVKLTIENFRLKNMPTKHSRLYKLYEYKYDAPLI